MTNETVKFNVGGSHFEVSRSLIKEHSETVLGKLVSDAWNDDRGKEEVFIDRSGKIFEHVLEYLRYGSIPRSMFDRELDYYGIPSFEGTIDEESLPKLVKSFTAPLVQAQKKHASFSLAHECSAQFNTKMLNKPDAEFVKVDLTDLEDSLFEHFDQKLLDTYLEKYFGLAAVGDAGIGFVNVYLISAPAPAAPTTPAQASGQRAPTQGFSFPATGSFGTATQATPATAGAFFGAPASATGGIFGHPAPAPFGAPFHRGT